MGNDKDTSSQEQCIRSNFLSFISSDIPSLAVAMLKEGDFILMHYTAKIKETGEVFDTTIEEDAKKNNIYKEGVKYKPLFVIVGEGRLVQGLEEAIKELDVNQEKEIEVPPEKGFGLRDANKIKIVSLGELKRQGINPYPGMELRTESGERAIVRSVSGGRVTLDFNHPLSGKTLIYKVKILKKVEEPMERISLLLEKWFEIDASKFNVTVTNNNSEVEIIIPRELFSSNLLQVSKVIVAKYIIDYIYPNAKIKYIEVYDRDAVSKK